MSDSVPPVLVTSPVPVTLSSNSVEEWVDSFFAPKPEGIEQSNVTPPSYYSKLHFNPTALNSLQILEHCKETYSQVLHDHFEKNAIGGSTPFLQGRHLHDAIFDAVGKSIEECDVLMKISSSIHPKENCRDRIKAKLEAICGAFKKRNEDRRSQFITRSCNNIMSGFVKKLEKSYYLLHCEKEPEQVNHDGTLNGRPIPHEKFYEHQQMTKLVGDMINVTLAKYDILINKVKLSPSESSSIVSSDDGLKIFDHAKISIKRHGDDLLAKNAAHQGMTREFIEFLISTKFEEMCKREIKTMSFPEVNDVKAIVLKIKEDIRKDIRKLLHKNSVDTENSSMLESEYHGELEAMEASVFKTCLKLAIAESERSIKRFVFKVEEELNPEKAVVWISKLAKDSKVPDNCVAIVKDNLMKALTQIKEDCLGAINSSENDSVHSEEAAGFSMDPKNGENSVKRNEKISDNILIEKPGVLPRPSSSTTSRKHEYPSSNRSHNREYSNERGSSEKRGRRF